MVTLHEFAAVVIVMSQVGAFSGIGVVQAESLNIPQLPTTWLAVKPVSVLDDVPFALTVFTAACNTDAADARLVSVG